jgi:DNA-binding CsgD family transcriptional regulator
MREQVLGLVLVGDVVESRRDLAGASRWTQQLTAELEAWYGPQRLAPFGFTHGDEVQGLLRPTADPFAAVLIAALHETPRAMRWGLALGRVEPGQGNAPQWTGEAFLAARALVEAARHRRDRLLVTTGDPTADALLDDLAPVLGASLEALTSRQRTIARLMLLEGCRQADVAVRLGISRATVSVAHTRGHLREVGRLLAAIRAIHRDGVTRSSKE